MSTGSAATEAVIAGAYEMGKGSLVASKTAHLKSLPLTIVGSGGYRDVKSPFTMVAKFRTPPPVPPSPIIASRRRA